MVLILHNSIISHYLLCGKREEPLFIGFWIFLWRWRSHRRGVRRTHPEPTEYAGAELVLFSSFVNKEVKIEEFHAERRDLVAEVLVVAYEFAEKLVSHAFNREASLVEQVLEAQKYPVRA